MHQRFLVFWILKEKLLFKVLVCGVEFTNGLRKCLLNMKWRYCSRAAATESITITPADARWVGAWWLGYLIAGVITLLAAIPFWFLPRSLPLSGPRRPDRFAPEQASFIKDSPLQKHKYPAENKSTFVEMAKGEEESTHFSFHPLLQWSIRLIFNSNPSVPFTQYILEINRKKIVKWFPK